MGCSPRGRKEPDMTERLQDALKILIFNELKQIKGKKTHPKQKPPVMAFKKTKTKKELKGKTSMSKQLNIYKCRLMNTEKSKQGRKNNILCAPCHLYIYMGFPSGSAWNIRGVV